MPKVKVDYNGVSKTYTSAKTLNTAARVMATNMVLTPQLDTGETIPSGTLTITAAGTVNCTNYASVSVPAATPAFDGGALDVSGSATASGTNASLSTTNESGIAVVASGTATPTRASVLYNGAVNGWVNKADNATALASGTGTAKALTSTTYYVNNLTVPNGKTLTVNEVSSGGELDIYNNAGTITVNVNDNNVFVNNDDTYGYIRVNRDNTNFPTGQAYIAGHQVGVAIDSALNEVVTDDTTGYLVIGNNINNTTGGPDPYTLNSGKQVKVERGWHIHEEYYQAAADPHTLYTPSSTYFKIGTGGAVSGASIPSNKYSSVTYYVKAATPAFKGGTLSVSGTASATATNASLSSTNNSGIVIIASGTAAPSRTSVLYNRAVEGWVSKADNDVALSSSNGSAKNLTQTTYYVNNVTVPSGKTLNADLYGNFVPLDAEGTGIVTIGVDDYYGKVKVSDTIVYNDGLVTANPSFIGGTLTLNGAATYTSSNISVSATNSSGISVRPSAAFTPTRSSVLYASAVQGWVTKSNGAVALAADAGSSVSLNGDTIYITGVTVPSGKTFTVNGGGDKGVKVEYKKVTVDTYPVTDTNGDLLVPTYSGTSLTYPAPGIFSDSASTTTMTIQGNVTVINGLTVKDVNAVPGSGTAPSNVTYNYYLAKWQTAASLTTGPKVTISTSTPSGGSNGDIWYQVLS